MFSKDKINKFCPVDKYVGGAEHACMHLLYARFFTKAMRDIYPQASRNARNINNISI
jgi:leucyl-tRNA synthetase